MSKQKYISGFGDFDFIAIGKGQTKKDAYNNARRNYRNFYGENPLKGTIITHPCSERLYEQEFVELNLDNSQLIDGTFYSLEEVEEFEKREQQDLYDELIRLTDDGVLWDNAKNIFSSFSIKQQNLFILEQILEVKHRLNNFKL